MIYILIMIFMIDKGGVTIQQEFNSLQACQEAGKMISQQVPQHYPNYMHQMKSVCVAKGEKK